MEAVIGLNKTFSSLSLFKLVFQQLLTLEIWYLSLGAGGGTIMEGTL